MRTWRPQHCAGLRGLFFPNVFHLFRITARYTLIAPNSARGGTWNIWETHRDGDEERRVPAGDDGSSPARARTRSRARQAMHEVAWWVGRPGTDATKAGIHGMRRVGELNREGGGQDISGVRGECGSDNTRGPRGRAGRDSECNTTR